LLAGDFNETKSLEERDHDGDDMLRRCLKFNNFIENNGLIDLGFSGPKFTWAHGTSEQTRKQARLDRAICNMEWRSKFQEATVRHLAHSYSDHCPLLINTMGTDQPTSGTRPFKFQAVWMEHHNFKDFIIQHWHPNLPWFQHSTI